MKKFSIGTYLVLALDLLIHAQEQYEHIQGTVIDPIEDWHEMS
jgi:hypothetical protein